MLINNVGLIRTGVLGKELAAQEKLDLENASPLRKFILSSDYSAIGNCVVAGSLLSKSLATTATSICRRRFKADDIILMILLDEEEEGEAGIAFTEMGIYCWEEEEEFLAEIMYDSIRDVDYDEESTIVYTMDGKEIELYCGEDTDEKYSRYLYNFIMDIKDALESGDLTGKGVHYE